MDFEMNIDANDNEWKDGKFGKEMGESIDRIPETSKIVWV